MNLDAYLERIGHSGPVAPTLECLAALHRRHALAVPYENLDVQLGVKLTRDTTSCFDKIVTRKRGGWCYEQHALFLWVLQQIGFDAMIVTAAVHRREFGDVKMGNHTAIVVDLDEPWLADLGLGDGIRDPIPLKTGEYVQDGLSYRLEKLSDGHWRWFNHGFGFPCDFDFRPAPADNGAIDRWAEELQVSPDSVFVHNVVCQIMSPDSLVALTGRILRYKTKHGTAKKLLSENDFLPTLANIFGLDVPEAARLWPKIEQRHHDVFGDQKIEEIDLKGF